MALLVNTHKKQKENIQFVKKEVNLMTNLTERNIYKR